MFDLSRIPDPRVLAGTPEVSYRDPAALLVDGEVRLWFTENHALAEGGMQSHVSEIRSRDLVAWTAPRPITVPGDPANWSSPGNVVREGREWVMCLQTYPTPPGGYIGDDSCRIYTARSRDLESWDEAELLQVKGNHVSEEAMGRMIDPYLLQDKDDPGLWWCFYKQNGASISRSRDLRQWEYVGRTECGENVSALIRDDEYLLMHSPGADGMGLLATADLRQFRELAPNRIQLGHRVWPWARRRLTAGTVLDLRAEPGIGKYLMFYHGSAELPGMHEHVSASSLGLAWSNDLLNWEWPGGWPPTAQRRVVLHRAAPDADQLPAFTVLQGNHAKPETR